MRTEDFNSLLRTMVLELAEKGWGKTKISRILLGPNGQAQMNFFTQDGEKKPSDFGFRPLQRIADLIGYELHVSLVKPNAQIIEALEVSNIQFIQDLRDAIEVYLNSETNTPRISKQYTSAKLENLLDELLPD